MLIFILVICFVLACWFSVSDRIKTIKNAAFWAENENKNFPIYCHGRTVWRSRSCAVSLYTFCKNKEGEWCVLANKRGKGTPDFQGYWNCCCGYLDFNETGEEAAIRETREETGVNVPIEYVQFKGVNTSPKENNENVSLRYVAVLQNVTDDYTFSKKDMEKDEVDTIQWIPLSHVKDYKWAFNHDSNIEKLSKMVLI